MATNDFQPFATAPNANVINQSDFLASNWLPDGFSQGIAFSNQANKVWRQTSIIAAMIAQTIADVLGVDVKDDGTIATIEANFIALFHNLNRIYALDTGNVNNLVITLKQVPTGLASLVGTSITIKVANTNTAGSTLNINGLGAANVLNPDGTLLSAGQLFKGALATVTYDGTVYSLLSVLTGPLTAKANEWTQAQTWDATGTFKQAIAVAGSATASSIVSTGGVSAAAGTVITGYDANGAHLRTISGNYGAIFRNDGTSVNLLQTPSGNQFGSWNTFRPFAWNLTTGVVALDGTGVGASTGGAFSVGGPLSVIGTASVTGTTTAKSLVVNNVDAGGASIRSTFGNFGSILRNDGVQTYLLSTNSGDPNGVYNGLRPFSWNMTAGNVTIDATGAGINTGGNMRVANIMSCGDLISDTLVTASNGNVTAGNGRLRASFGAFNSGDPNAGVILNDYLISYSDSDFGYIRFPNGFIDQVTRALVPAGNGLTSTQVTLPVAFPNNNLDSIISFLGNTPPLAAGSIAVAGFSNSQVLVTTNYSNPGISQLGVVIRCRGN